MLLSLLFFRLSQYFSPFTSPLESVVNPTTQASSFELYQQYYYEWCS
jgi:hypothetical protein